MRPERFRRAKQVAAFGAVTLSSAALVIGLLTLVTGSRSGSYERLGLALASGSSSFTITSTIYTTPSGTYPAATCSGTPALLYPGVTRCAVFSVHNNLSVPIRVLSITSALDSSYPPPPLATCNGTYVTLPTYSSSVGFSVAGGSNANSPGVPIELKDSGTNQNPCQNFTYHLVYSGTAQYSDTTTTALTSSPNPSTAGQSVTFTATVTAGNPTLDTSLPTGTVSFYQCSTSAPCVYGPTNLLGSGTIGSGGKATFATSTLGVGTTYVEAVYPGSGTDFSASVSGVVAQVVNAPLIGTKICLTSTPNPSGYGHPVTLTATVTKTSGTGTPTGSVTFHLGSPSGPVVGTGMLNASAVASITTSTLPAGTDDLYAVYGGDTHFSGSTSPVDVQNVIGLPPQCTGTYPNFFYGYPWFPLINGTNGADFVYAVGGDYWINGFGGNDCIQAGDGDNWITDGNGNDVVIGGNGENYIAIGDGNDYVSVGNGSNLIAVGNGNDTVVVGNGPLNEVVVGNGTDAVTVGTGAFNTVTLGWGVDTVTVTSPTPLSPTHDTVYGGPGNETIYLGAGSFNAYYGAKGKANTCHLPKPPASWTGTPAAYYHDTITNCTVVTP